MTWEARLACLEAMKAQVLAENKRGGIEDWVLRAEIAEAKLAAVIALCDDPAMRHPVAWSCVEVLQVILAATGDTK